MQQDPNTVTKTVRLPLSIFSKLDGQAQGEGKSFNSYLTEFLGRHLEIERAELPRGRDRKEEVQRIDSEKLRTLDAAGQTEHVIRIILDVRGAGPN